MKKVSNLYRYIEGLHANKAWGSVLDAGSGINSLSWLTGLETTSITAVTGSIAEAKIIENAVASRLRKEDQLLTGNWVDPNLLSDAEFDTVLVDYLLGAIEGFSPYFQTYLFKRLKHLTKECMYITGLEPYVAKAKPKTKGDKLLWEIGRFRDACVLLKGGMPYREYPLPWAIDQLRLAGYEVISAKHFNLNYKSLFVKAQMNIAVSGIESFADEQLADALRQKAKALETTALEYIDKEGSLGKCQNYVIEAFPVR